MLRKAGLTEEEFERLLEGREVEYVVVIHSAEEGGYWVEVPLLPGCFAQGESIDDVLGEAKEAIASHLEALAADGQPVPTEPLIIATVQP